jgi:hypothetical protein
MSAFTDVVVIAGLGAAGIAAIAGELRPYVEMKRERRKALNRVLWCQLDLWSEVKRSDLGDGVEILFAKIAARSGVPIAVFAPPEARAKIAEILAENLIPKRDPQLDSKYEASVEVLASYEPVLAYRLSGKTELQRHKEQSDSYISAVVQQFGTNSEVDNAALGALNPFARAEVLRSALYIIEEDIGIVANYLGRRTQRQVKRILRSLADRLEQDFKQRVDEGVERVVTWMQSLSVTPLPSTESGQADVT